jgi:uncharacterized membrane protein YphA (DoxX/SURF4 family)
MINGDYLLIKYFGIMFLLTGIMRYYLPNDRKIELINMGLPNSFDYIILLFEIFVGIFLLFDLYDKIVILMILIIMVSIVTILIVFNNYNKIIGELNQIWTYQPTSMSVVLHLTYILMFIILLLNLNYKTNQK